MHASHASSCPAQIAVGVVSGKWKTLILTILMQAEMKRFGELRRLLRGITQRSLTIQLRELERDGVVLRTVYPQAPPRVEYSLTELGRTLVPILESLDRWGRTYLDRSS